MNTTNAWRYFLDDEIGHWTVTNDTKFFHVLSKAEAIILTILLNDVPH